MLVALPLSASVPVEHRALALCLPFVVLALVWAINPAGYVGGGSDDWRYLEAARCWTGGGSCRPATHWDARWPLIGPLAAALALGGESAATVAFVPALMSVAALATFVALVRRWWGVAAAAASGCVFALTPALNARPFQPAVDPVELVWLLAGALVLTTAVRRGRWRWAVAAGALFALASFARLTAVACAPMMLVALWPRQADEWPERLRTGAGVAIGAGAAWLAQIAWDAAVWGEPFLRVRLALSHTRVDSSDLASGTAAASPLFNAEVIAGWDRAQGIRFHWLVDGLLNLLASPQLYVTVLSAAALLLLARARGVGMRDTPIGRLALAAALQFGVVTYVLAINPGPRMVLPAIAVAAAVAGVAGARLWRAGARPLVTTCAVLLVLNAAASAHDSFRIEPAQATAARLVSRWSTTTLDDRTRPSFALHPRLGRMAAHRPGAPGRWLALTYGTCGGLARPGERVLAAERVARAEPVALARLRTTGLLRRTPEAVTLCVFDRAAGPRPPAG